MFKKIYFCVDENGNSLYKNPRMITNEEVDAI